MAYVYMYECTLPHLGLKPNIMIQTDILKPARLPRVSQPPRYQEGYQNSRTAEDQQLPQMPLVAGGDRSASKNAGVSSGDSLILNIPCTFAYIPDIVIPGARTERKAETKEPPDHWLITILWHGLTPKNELSMKRDKRARSLDSSRSSATACDR